MAVEFGSKACKDLFLQSEDYTFLNHGSFGAIPKTIFTSYKKLLDEVESCPDAWFRYKCQPLMRRSCDALAPIVNCSSNDLVIVENASLGIHTALKSVGLKPNQGVLVTKQSYPAIANTSNRFSTESASNYHVLDIDIPVSSREEIIDKYRSYLVSHPDIKVAVIDHITSPSAMVLPIKEIVEVCRNKGVMTIIDGAHAVGQMHIDLKEINPDFYASNVHKWLYCPRGCALLYIRPELQNTAESVLASNDHHKGYPNRFFYQGTRDYTPYCMIPESIEFQKMLGGREKIVSYCSELCSKSAKMLSERWTEPLLPIPEDMRPPNMALIRIPSILQEKNSLSIVDTLYQEYKINTAIELTANELWLRISCNVYNNESDYELLAEAMLDLMKNPDKVKRYPQLR